jgi:hypothetical protein
MQHAFALNLNTETTYIPPSAEDLTLPKLCRTSIVEGFRVDKITSEIYGKFVTSPYQSSTEQYNSATPRPTSAPREYVQPMVTGSIDNVVYVDFRLSNSDNPLSDEPASGRNTRGAGRKPASTVNPVAHLAVELLTDAPGEQPPLWLDNIIFGSCITAAGQSQNVCSVAMNEVVGALYLRELKVETLVAQGTPLRKAQRIIKAARHAAHGIHHYLASRPRLLQSYEDAATLEASLAPSNQPLALHASTGGSKQH